MLEKNEIITCREGIALDMRNFCRKNGMKMTDFASSAISRELLRMKRIIGQNEEDADDSDMAIMRDAF